MMETKVADYESWLKVTENIFLTNLKQNTIIGWAFK